MQTLQHAVGVDFDQCRAYYMAKPKWAQFSNSGKRTVDKMYFQSYSSIHPLSFILFVAIHHPHSLASATSCVTGKLSGSDRGRIKLSVVQLCCWCIVVGDGQRLLLFQLFPLDCTLSAANTSA